MTAVDVIGARGAATVPTRSPGTVVGGRVARAALWSGTRWGVVFGVVVLAQLLAYAAAYPTSADRLSLMRAYGNNPGLNALIGRAREIDTVPGYADWRLLGILGVLGALWGLLTATRLVRGEEDAGRTDLLLAGATTRVRATVQAACGLGAGLVALFVLTAVGVLLVGRNHSIDLPVGRSLLFAVALAAAPALFLAVGMLTSQLAGTRRQAAALAALVFAVAYVLRMLADSGPGARWLVWVTPLGWIEEAKPLSHPRPVPLLAVFVLAAVLLAVAVRLSAERDVGAGTVPARTTARPRLRLLGGHTGLALRLTLPTTLGWLAGMAALAALLGSIARTSTADSSGSVDIASALARIGGRGSLAAIYLGLTFLVLALMIALLAAGHVSAAAAEETEGRLTDLLVRPLSRRAWLAGRLVVGTAAVATAGVVTGLAAVLGTAGQDTGVGAGALVAAGLNVAAPGVLLLGLGALVLGVRPGAAPAVVYGYLTWSFLLELLGATVHVSHWLLDTSVVFHLTPAPASAPDWVGVGAIVGLGLLGMAAGSALLTRRDVVQG